MPTKLLYLDDFDVTECQATIISVTEQKEVMLDIVLDQTSFYPKGGGQACDQGRIFSDDKNFTVENVVLDESGVVHHIGIFETERFGVGDNVSGIVNQQRRNLNSRLHSAGHLLDMAVDKIGLSWKSVKAAHLPHQSFVDYDGQLDIETRDQLVERLNEALKQISDVGGENEIRFMPVDEMSVICKNVPSNIPTNKPARVIVYPGEFGIPCGGTHVKNISDIGEVVVTKMKNKDGNIRISYKLKLEIS